MISANELRIGNWYVNQWGEYLQVDADLFGADNLESYPIPIPLTPEILEKLGFEFDTITFSRSYFLLAGGDNGFDVWIGGLSKVKLNPIKYVHELQNLFYAITKEELNYSI